MASVKQMVRTFRRVKHGLSKRSHGFLAQQGCVQMPAQALIAFFGQTKAEEVGGRLGRAFRPDPIVAPPFDGAFSRPEQRSQTPVNPVLPSRDQARSA